MNQRRGKMERTIGMTCLLYTSVIAGIAEEYVERLEKAKASYGHEYCPHHQSVTLVHPFYSRILCFEMIKEAGVDLLMHCELSSATAVSYTHLSSLF